MPRRLSWPTGTTASPPPCPTCGNDLPEVSPGGGCVICRAERNLRPAPTLGEWCPTCAEYALPMRNGTCGFCDTPIEAAA